MTITERAREIVAETGCSMVDAVSRAYDELDPDRVAHLVNAAKAYAEVMSVLHPERTFVGIVTPKGRLGRTIEVAPGSEWLDKERRAAAEREPRP